MSKKVYKVQVIDPSKNPPCVDEGRPSDIAAEWIPKVVGTRRYIKQFSEKAENGYIATTREGVEKNWLSNKSNHGKQFPAHKVRETPDGCYGLFYLSSLRVESSLNDAVRDGEVNEGYERFQFKRVSVN